MCNALKSAPIRRCRYVAENAGVIVAQADFRLAPEFPTPAQLNDSIEAFK